MAKKHKKSIEFSDSKHLLIAQTLKPLDMVFSKQAAKFCLSEFKKEPKKAKAVEDAILQLKNSAMHDDTAVMNGKKIEMKVMTAGGLSKHRGRQLSINVGNDRIRLIVCREGESVFIARGFIKKDDGKDYIRHCEEAKEAIKLFTSKGFAVELSKVFPKMAQSTTLQNTNTLKARF